MCRFALYLGEEITVGSLVTEPTHSIIHQSQQSREQEEAFNGDGFGVAWYVPALSSEPALFKDVTPAWNNLNLSNLARVTKSSCILAHVRAATPGIPVTRLNCHPFAWGPFSFMHNGRVAGFQQLRRRLLNRLSDDTFQVIQGSTDSEHVFALFLEHYRSLGPASDRSQNMAAALESTLEHLEELRRSVGVSKPSLLNLAVTDGSCAVCCRFVSKGSAVAKTLYLSQGGRYRCLDGACQMIGREEGGGAVLVASEPLSAEPGWQPIGRNTLLVIDQKLQVSQLRLSSLGIEDTLGHSTPITIRPSRSARSRDGS